ncbi:MAG: PRK06851 family protein [Firmicutes bacterium]|nr:PRK06851 family protein [Bacillota bacterium]
MKKGRVRNFFPGNNTPLGFFSYYDHIAGPEATRIIIIKGGPGVGKSSFMKEIAALLNQQGFDVELHHCSSDNNSLDGVVFPQIKVALIDGTSPHIVDPRNPGVVDEILHLGDYWNEAEMRQGRSGILTLNQEVGRWFARAYRYLKAAKIIHEDIEAVYREAVDWGQVNQITAGLIDAIFERRPISPKPGKIRRLFISAITPDGFRNFLPGLTEMAPTIYAVEGAPGTGKATLLAKMAGIAGELGIDCEAFCCAFDPSKIEHLLFSTLGVLITTAVPPHRIDPDQASFVVNLNQCVDLAKTIPQNTALETAKSHVDNLLKQGIAAIAQAKAAHDRMEEYYTPHMNFAAINELRRRTAERILQYAAGQLEQETCNKREMAFQV